MTDLTSIARPYAKAVFEFAQEHRQLANWSKLLEYLTQLTQDPVFIAFITNPATSTQQHSQILLAMLKQWKGTEISHAQSFVELLAHNKRILALPSLYSIFQELRADYEKTLTVHVVSFSPLSKEQATQLTNRLSTRLQRDITLAVTVDPSILGGAIIRAGNLVYDGSVKTQIKNLSHRVAA